MEEIIICSKDKGFRKSSKMEDVSKNEKNIKLMSTILIQLSL
jgi:hypothetical protein